MPDRTGHGVKKPSPAEEITQNDIGYCVILRGGSTKMGSTENINIGDARFQGLLERFLRIRSAGDTAFDADRHLDEDTFAAFVEGNLTMREASPIVSHLAECGFCRHKTAELVRLDLAFAELELPASTSQTAPVRTSNVIEGILSRLFGTGDAAVMAHEEKPADERSSEDEKTERE